MENEIQQINPNFYIFFATGCYYEKYSKIYRKYLTYYFNLRHTAKNIVYMYFCINSCCKEPICSTRSKSRNNRGQ